MHEEEVGVYGRFGVSYIIFAFVLTAEYCSEEVWENRVLLIESVEWR